MIKQPIEYERHVRGDGKRFHVRTYNNGLYQVYGLGLDHICECENEEIADMIAMALEKIADQQEKSQNLPVDQDVSENKNSMV